MNPSADQSQNLARPIQQRCWEAAFDYSHIAYLKHVSSRHQLGANTTPSKLPSEKLRVYAVWPPMLGGDAREEWNGTPMPDLRLTHFWDGDALVGQWFAQRVNGYEGIAWDIYYLYGPETTWETVPIPLAGSGGTIIGERDTLQAQLSMVLEK